MNKRLSTHVALATVKSVGPPTTAFLTIVILSGAQRSRRIYVFAFDVFSDLFFRYLFAPAIQFRHATRQTFSNLQANPHLDVSPLRSPAHAGDIAARRWDQPSMPESRLPEALHRKSGLCVEKGCAGTDVKVRSYL